MIEAVAFDIDGTLYPQWRFTLLTWPFFVAHAKTMLNFRKVRKNLHKISEGIISADDKTIPNLFDFQAKLLGEKIGKSPSDTKKWLQDRIYKGWKPIFQRLKPYAGAVSAVETLKTKGYKIGLLSDFPPEQKGDVWGIAPLCDAIVGAEYGNALKPSPIPFLELSRLLGSEPEKILYVGNSYKYDILGAKSVGMKTALICSAFKKKRFSGTADIVFSTYKELLDRLTDFAPPAH